MISKLYVSLNLAGLFRILTPSRDTTDIFAVVVGQDWLFEKRWGVSYIFAAYCCRDQCREVFMYAVELVEAKSRGKIVNQCEASW